MVADRYLEYFALDSILQGYMCSSSMTLNSKDKEVWLANGSTIDIDLNAMKNRMTKIQLEILEPYVINKSGNSK